MKKQITITVPTDWSAITLRKYLELKKDVEAYEDNNEAVFAALCYHLCGLDPKMLQGLDVETIKQLETEINSLMENKNYPLKQFITIDGIEYGFEPNLSKMAYGAYVDISAYDTISIDDKWGEILSILYRPVVKKNGSLYSIEKYEGKIDKEKFLDTTMDIHWGCLFFFTNLLTTLLINTPKSLMAKHSKELLPKYKSILEKSGKAIQHSLNSPAETLRKLIK